MTTVRFVFQRHPFDPQGGGSSRIARLLMEAAAQSAQVTASALSPTYPLEAPWPIAAIAKPTLDPLRVGLRSVLERRSLIHTRFRVGALTEQLRTATEDVLAVNHTYMAECVLRAIGTSEAAHRLAISLDVAGSEVLRSGEGHRHLRAVEASRTFRDEVRCLAAARSTAGFDLDEVALYARAGIAGTHLLRPCFAPIGQPGRDTPARLLFLADRTWRPNYAGLEHLLSLWGSIRAKAPQAELLVVGHGPVPATSSQDGVAVVGYVESLDDIWREVRALAAPITIGGGVRIKVLDAAAHGVPVVASPQAVGSIDRYLPITPAHSDAEFIDQCIELLHDVDHAHDVATELFEANQAWWSQGAFTNDVAAWLGLGITSSKLK